VQVVVFVAVAVNGKVNERVAQADDVQRFAERS